MIEFKGNLTGNSKKFLLKKQVKIQTISSAITTVIFSIPIILFAISVNPLILLFLLVFAVLMVGSIFPPSKSSQKIFMPKRVYIDLTEETIVHESEKTERFHMIKSVKTVFDYGEWYYIVFEYADRDPYFVCQKDLLTQGTPREFEALFEGKIVRKELK